MYPITDGRLSERLLAGINLYFILVLHCVRKEFGIRKLNDTNANDL